MDSEHLVIFDCDGVLVDSEPLYVRVDTEMIIKMGWAITEDEVIERFQGTSHAFMMDTIEQRLGREARLEWEPRMQERRREIFERELQPVEGIGAALDQLDLTTCVASSSTHEFIELVLRITGLFDRFEGRIFSAEEVPNAKPAPDVFLHAATSMRFEPSRCIVVEDSVHGVEAGRAAEMTVLGYDPDGTKGLDGPNTTVFDSMTALPELVRGAQTPDIRHQTSESPG